MENASKALLIAAGVLMGVLILSLAVYLFSTFKGTAEDNYDRMRTEELAQFNSFYLAYEGRADITYYEIWNVVNKAKDYNAKDEGERIVVIVNDGSGYSSRDRTEEGLTDLAQIKLTKHKDLDDKIESITDDEGTEKKQLKKYECTKVDISSATGRVEKITFKLKE